MLARYVHARLWWRVTGQRYSYSIRVLCKETASKIVHLQRVGCRKLQMLCAYKRHKTTIYLLSKRG